MKRLRVILLITVAMLLITSCVFGEHIAKTRGVRVYRTDYIKKYERTLNAMFDHNWTLISTEERYEEHEPVCAHLDTRPQRFIEWTIEYRDGNDALRTFVFDNRRTLAEQIEEYVIHYIADYYKEHFYDAYTKEMPLAGSSYVYCFFVRMSSFVHYEVVRDIDETTKKYRSLLDTSEGTICLSKLTPANVFEMCPVYLSVRVGLSGDSGYGRDMEERIIKQTEDMMEAMNEFANHRLNAEVHVGYHQIVNMHDGNRGRGWAFLQGKRVGSLNDRILFESYEGLFW